MKLTFKTLKQEQFQLEVEETDTMLEVKQKIEAKKGYDVALQKLIFSGRVLADSKTVGECDITESGFVVVMVTTAKKPATSTSASVPTPTPASAPATTTTPPRPAAPTPATPSEPTDSATTTDNTETAQPTPSTEPPTSASSYSGDANATLLTGSSYEQAVQNIVEMGFPREQVMRAMRASFNNPDRAVEYLMTDIPDIPDDTPQSGSAVPTAPAGETGETGGDGGETDISFLRSSPQFQQLRQMVRTNPQLLQPLLQQLAHANPQLMHRIEANQQEFMNLLSEGSDNEGDAEASEGSQPNVHFIRVTEEEKEAIDRLVAMGFDRVAAAEAYFACDKNEELAANFLFDNAGGEGGL